jgi:hypothetical protein
MTEAEKSAAPEIRHWHCEIESRVNKFAQDLHVLEMAVEAVKEGLDPGSKGVCFFVLHRPRGKVRYVAQCFVVLQQYVHKCIGCGYAAVRVLDFEFSRTREGHLGSRPGKRARPHIKIPLFRRMSRACKLEAIQRIAPKVLLPGRGLKMGQKDTLCQKSGYRGRNG